MTDQADRLYTAEQVRRLDQYAIEHLGIPGMTLMERAGASAFGAAREAFPDARRILVFCGGGNNGGDGYVVARLAREAGLAVTVCALKAPDALQGDAAAAARRWLDARGTVCDWPAGERGDHDLLFDALLGTGLDREPAGVYGEAVDWMNASACPVFAIDIPSGLNADTGVAMGRAVRAELTATFIGAKRGLFTADGPDYAGDVRFFDLDTPDEVRDSQPDSGILIHENNTLPMLPARRRNSHKGSYGWLLVVGSEAGMSGAIRLCGEAALRSGAGKVTLATKPEHASLVNVGCPELMVRGAGSADDIEDLLAGTDVIVTGTGLGRTGWSEAMFRACMKAGKPLVLDADGLNELARLRGSLADDELPLDNWVLTPHPAEAGRLLGCSAREVQQDRFAAALEIASRYRAVVVLKGCGTVVAAPDSTYAVCPLGNPGMATAGSGDVLAGVIGAMACQGLGARDAAVTGVVAHAAAGDLAAGLLGERGMIASDITGQLPFALNPAF